MSLSTSWRALSWNTMCSSGLLVLKEYSKNNKSTNGDSENDQNSPQQTSLNRGNVLSYVR